jgi:hemin uptake protein HemP
MTRLVKQEAMQADDTASSTANACKASVKRIKSRDLLQQMREIEIDHEGRIYRLRLTQFNKLILTA